MRALKFMRLNAFFWNTLVTNKNNLNKDFVNSKIELSFLTYVSPFEKSRRPLNLTHYYYFCCYLWLLRDLHCFSHLDIFIVRRKKKYFTFLKSSKCHKKGKYSFWFIIYKIYIKFFDFINDLVVNSVTYKTIFYYLQDFYSNLSSSVVFQSNFQLSLKCHFFFLNFLINR